MSFGVYLPPAAEKTKVPFLIWLSGLTGRDNTFPFLAGAQRYAAERGIAIVTPDTCPRGEGVPDDPDGAYDFGLSAGFYLNATQLPWQKNYHMYDYVVDEFSTLIVNQLPIDSARQSIFGHSMGGHGAITIALKIRDDSAQCQRWPPFVILWIVPGVRKHSIIILGLIAPLGVNMTPPNSWRPQRNAYRSSLIRVMRTSF
jgi:S-formylglutathione hydrolase